MTLNQILQKGIENGTYPFELTGLQKGLLGEQVVKYLGFATSSPFEKIQVTEPHGSFKVNVYPTEIVPVIERVIASYYKGIIEKPIIENPSKTTSVPTSTTKRVRKRIPSNLAFSGRSLKK
jgi:hypothetical protein